MELRDITMDDLWLYSRLLTDPSVMSELGGPITAQRAEEKLRGIVDDVEAGRAWFLVVRADGAEAVGTVCVWRHEGDGEQISEIGWMILPEHQGRGVATAAVRSVLGRAAREHRWGSIHAYPATTNAASNAICRKTGFRLDGQRLIEFEGATLRCNRWIVEP